MAHRTTRRTATALAVICGLLGTPLPAQEPAAPDPPLAQQATAAPGPRLAPEWRRVEPRLAGDAAPTASYKKDSVTIHMSTLVLVLCVIILVLLIA